MRKLLRVTVPIIVGVTLLVIGTPAVVTATPPGIPEIDPSSAMAAVALLAGVGMMIRGRRKTSTD
jgi:hypothetical protein